jgi:hypothetical protein
VIDAIDNETGNDVGIQIESNPNGSFTMVTQIKEYGKTKAAAEVVDLTNDDKKDGNDSFSSAGVNLPAYLFDEADTPTTHHLKESEDEDEDKERDDDDEDKESDDEIEFLGCDKKMQNASLVQSDTSSEYESAVGFSQEVFSVRIPPAPGPRRSNRQFKGKKAN